MTIEHLYDPLDPATSTMPTPRAERDRTFQICSRLPHLREVLPEFKSLFRMIDGTIGGGRVGAHRRRAQAGRRRVLPVQALLRHLPVHARPAAGVADRLPAADAALARRSRRSRARCSAAPGCSRAPTCRARSRRALSGMVNRTNDFKPVRFLMEKATGIARNRLLPTFANVRFSKWFTSRRGSAARRRGDDERVALPDVPRRVPGPRDRQGDGRGLRAQRLRLRPARRSGVLRDAVARRGRRRTVRGRGTHATSRCSSTR